MQRLQNLLVAAVRSNLASGRARVPEGGALLWNAFGELSATRTYHASGPNPISHAEIEAWCRLFRMPLQPHHVAILRAMDMAWIEHTYRQIIARTGGDKGALRITGKEPAMTAELFDAVFG